MRRLGSVLCVSAAAAAIVTAVAVRHTSAQDDAPAGGPSQVLSKVMASIGSNQVDDAVAQMDGLKDNGAEKDGVRAALLAVRDVPHLGAYHGYDVPAVVHYSARLQTLDVLAYYDLQPVLYRFEYYQPSDNAAWQVLDLRVDWGLTTAMETLRDDASNSALGRGGRAAR
jgi:hypothetical protein